VAVTVCVLLSEYVWKSGGEERRGERLEEFVREWRRGDSKGRMVEGGTEKKGEVGKVGGNDVLGG
jgi:hypothetical protein